jgi:lipid A ethanolaminephosphotransferase
LIYTSDHGESLEDGIYLHAAPYDTAPMNQKLVPMLVWMPKHNDNINIECVRKKAQNNKHSHDNIFHSLLGISGIKSQHYLSELDIFYSCKK